MLICLFWWHKPSLLIDAIYLSSSFSVFLISQHTKFCCYMIMVMISDLELLKSLFILTLLASAWNA